MTKVDIGGTILRGAFAKWFGRDTPNDNPYPDMPGYYILHKAWRFGFENSETVLMEHEQAPLIAAARPPGQRRASSVSLVSPVSLLPPSTHARRDIKTGDTSDTDDGPVSRPTLVV